MKLITQPSREVIMNPITNEIKLQADEHARHITTTHRGGKHRYDSEKGNDKYSQHYIGQIGELIVRQYLTSNNIKFETQEINENGCGDNYDLIIYGKFFDVKTKHIMKEDWIKNDPFLVPVDQMYRKGNLKSIDYYIDVALDKNMQHAYIRGFVSQSDILELYSIPTKINSVDNFDIPLGDLRPISDLISTNWRQ